MLSVNLLSGHSVGNAQDHRVVAEHVMHVVIVHIADGPLLIILSRVRADVVIWRMKLQVGSGFRTDIPMGPLRRLFRRVYFRETEFVEIVLRISIGLFKNAANAALAQGSRSAIALRASKSCSVRRDAGPATGL